MPRRSASRATSRSASTCRRRRVGADLGRSPCRRTAPLDARDIPSTYVPARNTVFLSLALAGRRSSAPRDIVIGVNALDYSGYPDCRPEYLAAFERLAALATKAGVGGRDVPHPRAAACSCRRREIIRRGLALGLDYGLTHSCYDPDAGRQAVRPLRQLPAARKGIRGGGRRGSPDARRATGA